MTAGSSAPRYRRRRRDVPGRLVRGERGLGGGLRGEAEVISRAVDAVVDFAAPIVDACRALARVSKVGLWDEVIDGPALEEPSPAGLGRIGDAWPGAHRAEGRLLPGLPEDGKRYCGYPADSASRTSARTRWGGQGTSLTPTLCATRWVGRASRCGAAIAPAAGAASSARRNRSRAQDSSSIPPSLMLSPWEVTSSASI